MITQDIALHPKTRSWLEQIPHQPAQGYLLAGPRYMYKDRAADELALALSGAERVDDPNILRIMPGESGKIKISQVGEMLHWLTLRPYQQGQRRVIILAEAHTLTLDASNALLKVLEEPNDNVTFLVTTQSRGMMLPTLRSRLQTVLFLPPEADALPPRLSQIWRDEPQLQQQYQQIVVWAERFLSGTISQRFLVAKQVVEAQLAYECIVELQRQLRGKGIASSRSAARLTLLMQAEAWLKSNLNPRLVLERVALEFAP